MKMHHKICFLNKGSIHYRKNVWILMDQELDCDFFFGDNRRDSIKPIDTSLLKNFKGYFHNIFLGRLFWQKGALKLFKLGYTDIIAQGDVYNLTVWAILFLAKIKKKNVYLWTHGAYGDEKGLKRRIIALLNKLATGSFLYGDHARRLLIEWGIPANKLHLIYNSLDYDHQLPIRQSMSLDSFYQQHFNNDNYNLVFIGRLTTVKKLHLVLEAVALLKEQGKRFNITFVGDGDIKPNLESLAKDLGIEDVTWFYGACYDEHQIAEFLYNADLCVSPGNVGLTAMHAMTFGCPVVSHDNFIEQMPEYEAIEDGKTGTFFSENSISSLALAIERWLSGVKDREEIRKNCYKVIDDKYNPHKQVETLRATIINN